MIATLSSTHSADAVAVVWDGGLHLTAGTVLTVQMVTSAFLPAEERGIL